MHHARKIVFAIACASVLAACAGPREIAARDCPAIGVLSSADRLQADTGTGAITAASLTCKRTAEGRLLADIVIAGNRPQTPQPVKLFVAALTGEKRVIERQQFALVDGDGPFSLTVQDFEYDQLEGRDAGRALIVGFVLSDGELAANRQNLRQRYGLAREN